MGIILKEKVSSIDYPIVKKDWIEYEINEPEISSWHNHTAILTTGKGCFKNWYIINSHFEILFRECDNYKAIQRLENGYYAIWGRRAITYPGKDRETEYYPYIKTFRTPDGTFLDSEQIEQLKEQGILEVSQKDIANSPSLIE